MPHVAGDKIASSHTTVTERAALVVKELRKNPRVNKISLGPIDNSSGSGGSQTLLKIIDQRTCVVAAVSGGGSHQDIRIMLKRLERDRAPIKRVLAHAGEQDGWSVSFLDRR